MWCNKNFIFLFEKGYECRTIGCHNSAISAFHDYVDGKPVGQHPEVDAPVSEILATDHISLDICFMEYGISNYLNKN